MTRRGILADRADELSAMIRGMDATLKWFAVTPSLEIAGVLQSFFPDVERDLFAACIDRYRALSLWGPIRSSAAKATTACRPPCVRPEPCRATSPSRMWSTRSWPATLIGA